TPAAGDRVDVLAADSAVAAPGPAVGTTGSAVGTPAADRTARRHPAGDRGPGRRRGRRAPVHAALSPAPKHQNTDTPEHRHTRTRRGPPSPDFRTRWPSSCAASRAARGTARTVPTGHGLSSRCSSGRTLRGKGTTSVRIRRVITTRAG